MEPKKDRFDFWAALGGWEPFVVISLVFIASHLRDICITLNRIAAALEAAQ